METYVLGLVLALLEVPLVALGSAWFARRVRAGQYIRPEGPTHHAAKAGTPTMVGIVPLLGVFLGVGMAWAMGVPLSARAGFALAGAAAGGLIGLADDLLSQRHQTSLGLTVPRKLLLQTLAALALFSLTPSLGALELAVPFLGVSLENLPAWALFLLVLFGFMGTTNAVNLTDGLDGLACGAGVLVLGGLLPLVWARADLAVICLLGVGACGGFLWVNAYPAAAFLGDVGAMGLGGLIFGIALAGGAIFLLPLLGGLFVVEGISVILQVVAYKLTGKRLFRMAPLHHHLEAGPVPWPHRLPGKNWPEPKTVVRLWILSGMFVALGLVAWLAPI